MKIFRIFCAVIIIFSVVFTIFIGADKIKQTYPFVKDEEEKTIINLWHVDAFSSGTSSKKRFLLEVVRGFEKRNKSVILHLTTYDFKTAEINLKNGMVPDIISSGYGLEFLPTVVLDDKLNDGAGKIGNKTFSHVWCKGQYFLISKNQDKLNLTDFENVVYGGDRNFINNFINTDIDIALVDETQVVKLENLGVNFFANPLLSFNDRLQFVTITSIDTKKQIYCKDFIEYLVSNEVQMSLNKISAYSNFVKIDFNSEKLNSALNLDKYSTISLFNLTKNYSEYKDIIKKVILGDDSAKNKLKNIIVSS